MKLKKDILYSKLIFIIAPCIAILIASLFMLTLIPSIKQSPKELPIAIVNLDEGFTTPTSTINVGATIVSTLKKQIAEMEDPAIKFVEVSTYEKLIKGLDSKEYYAALVISKDFTVNQMSLSTANPKYLEVEVLVNQGYSVLGSTAASTVLTNILANVNMQISSKILTEFTTASLSLTPSQAQVAVNPLQVTKTNINEIGTDTINGNAPFSLFQPVWITSLLSAIFIYFTYKKKNSIARKDKIDDKSSQLIIGILVSFIAGFLITWLASSFGIGIDNYVSTSIFITVAIFAFFMMILATLELIGIGAIPLYVLLMFFGIPLLTMPLEFMPTFYSHYIYPWLPMRFFVDGLKELFFFNNDFTWNYPTMILTYIAIVSTLVLGLTAFKKAKHKPKKRTV